MDRILRVTGPRQTTNPPFLLSSFSPGGETDADGRRDDGSCPSPRPGLARRRRPPAPSKRESEGALCRARAERCTSVAAVYLMLIPAAATTESALLLLLDRKGTNGGGKRAATDSDRGLGRVVGRPMTMQSPEMIRTIWVNFKVLYKAYHLPGYHKYEPAVFYDNLRSNQFFEISPLDDHFKVCPFIFLSFPLKAIAVAPLFHSKRSLPPPHPPGGQSRSSVSVGWFSISFSLLLFFLEIGSRAEGERAGARHQT